MTAKVIYKGDLRAEATHLRSGTVIETDAPVDNKGKGERFSPTDLVGVALATCILTTMGISGAAHNINVDGAECDVEKVMASDPRRIAELKIHLRFSADKNYSDKEKVMLERIAHTCPVALSLHPELKQTISISWS